MTNRQAKRRLRALVPLAVGFALTGLAVPEVSQVRLTPLPEAGHVEVTYTLTGGPAYITLGVETNGALLPDRQVTSLTGDVSGLVADGAGRRIVWDAVADGAEVDTAVARARVTAWTVNAPPPILVIDLSSGPSATNYPVAYYPSAEALPEGGLTNALYRTNRLVMRRIRTQAPYPEDGVFWMGSPQGYPFEELGVHLIFGSYYEYLHEVRLTRDYYLGIYEVTQWQYKQVMNSTPSFFTNALYAATRPVERVSYVAIRGDIAYPSNDLVTASSFMGVLRAKSGLNTLDLPSEAQWEYACRAGSRRALNTDVNLTGTNVCANLNLAGRYAGNSGILYVVTNEQTQAGEWQVPFAQDAAPSNGTAQAGSYLPNAWGLYDMHGNVWEWCLDRWSFNLGIDPVTDPVMWYSPTSATPLGRSGGWRSMAQDCRSGYRNGVLGASSGADYLGFRVARTLP